MRLRLSDMSRQVIKEEEDSDSDGEVRNKTTTKRD